MYSTYDFRYIIVITYKQRVRLHPVGTRREPDGREKLWSTFRVERERKELSAARFFRLAVL